MSSTVEPNQQQHRDHEREQHLLAVPQRQPQPVTGCAANIAPRRAGAGRGVNVPGGNRPPGLSSRAQLPAGQLEEHVFETSPATCASSASTACAAHQPVIDESTAGSIQPCTTYRPASVSAAR